MQLVVAERDPCVDLALAFLGAVRLKESGSQLSSAPSPLPAGDVAGTLTLSTQAWAALRALEHAPDAGVVLLAPSLGLRDGGILHTLLSRGLDPRRLTAFGVRDLLPQEWALLERHRAGAFPMRRIVAEGLAEMTDAAMERARAQPRCHLLVSLDVLDPAFAPGLASPSPGGLSTRELLYAVQRLRLVKEISSCELVVDAREDEATARVAAKLLAELL